MKEREKYVWTDMMVGVGGCVPCFYDDTIFQFHLSENNICLAIMWWPPLREPTQRKYKLTFLVL